MKTEKWRRKMQDEARVLDSRDPAQLPLMPGARTADPETSHEAAESMARVAHGQRLQIVQYLIANGPRTADELDEALDLRPTSAGRRLPELQSVGLAWPLDETRPTRWGRAARLWQASLEVPR